MPAFSSSVDAGGKKPLSEPVTVTPALWKATARALVAMPDMPMTWTFLGRFMRLHSRRFEALLEVVDKGC